MGGRKAGTPNKVQSPVKQLLKDFVMDNWDTFVESFKQIDDPAEKCKIIKDMLPYCAPKLSSVEVKDTVKQDTFQEELNELMGITK